MISTAAILISETFTILVETFSVAVTGTFFTIEFFFETLPVISDDLTDEESN